MAGGGGERDARGLVHASHFGGFREPVFGVVLDDAERVDPDVGEVQAPGVANGVLEGLRDLVPGDDLQVAFEGGLCGAERLAGAPAVAEARVGRFGGIDGVLGDETNVVV